MAVTGHQTGAVFDRYHIVSLEELREASRPLESMDHTHGPFAP